MSHKTCYCLIKILFLKLMFVDNTDLNNFHENYLPECLLIPPVTTYHLICATTPVRVVVAKMCKPENTTKERFGAFSRFRHYGPPTQQCFGLRLFVFRNESAQQLHMRLKFIYMVRLASMHNSTLDMSI